MAPPSIQRRPPSMPGIHNALSHLNDQYLQSKEKQAENILYGDGSWEEIESGILKIVMPLIPIIHGRYLEKSIPPILYACAGWDKNIHPTFESLVRDSELYETDDGASVDDSVEGNSLGLSGSSSGTSRRVTRSASSGGRILRSGRLGNNGKDSNGTSKSFESKTESVSAPAVIRKSTRVPKRRIRDDEILVGNRMKKPRTLENPRCQNCIRMKIIECRQRQPGKACSACREKHVSCSLGVKRPRGATVKREGSPDSILSRAVSTQESASPPPETLVPKEPYVAEVPCNNCIAMDPPLKCEYDIPGYSCIRCDSKHITCSLSDKKRGKRRNNLSTSVSGIRTQAEPNLPKKRSRVAGPVKRLRSSARLSGKVMTSQSAFLSESSTPIPHGTEEIRYSAVPESFIRDPSDAGSELGVLSPGRQDIDQSDHGIEQDVTVEEDDTVERDPADERAASVSFTENIISSSQERTLVEAERNSLKERLVRLEALHASLGEELMAVREILGR
ncbi:hypothetical protein ABKN59_009391 [Abortiporus biennis]